MLDKNNNAIQTGDICEITGAYFKNDNGFWLVTACAGDPTTCGSDITLKKLGKTGKLLESGSTVAFWPLKSFCSDRRKNAAAREHNREHAQIERVNSVPTWYAAQYFRKESEEAAQRAENRRNAGFDPSDIEKTQQIADFYAAVAGRIGEGAEQPKEKAPETGIRFYWNGIKVDGGKLIKCGYYMSENSVSIYVRDYSGRLPTEYFTVKNDTDLYTDYHDTDRATLTPEHPLYKFVRYMALKVIMNGRSYTRPTAEQAAEWERTKDPGQPTSADLAAVEELNTAKESARIAAEHAEQLAMREKVLNEQHAGRVYIEEVAAAHPIADGAPYVVIEWSEHPAFYSFSEALKLSFAAAEIILKHYDEQTHAENENSGRGGYFKTKFTIYYTDPESGEQSTYTGRYDLGDHAGGLIQHIRDHASWCKESPYTEQEAEEILTLADYLEQYTDGGRVISVTVPTWFKQAAWKYKQQKKAQREQAEQDAAEILETVEMLTDEQIEAAIRAIDPNDKEKLDVARFFLQELMRRDKEKALEIYRDWRGGAA